MTIKKEQEYKYLLRTYSMVSENLKSDSIKSDELPDIIIGFCIVIERVLKIGLYRKNPVLIYDNGWLKDENNLVCIVKRKKNQIETIKKDKLISRYNLVFEGRFTKDEVEIIDEIYLLRNQFIHSHEKDKNILINEEEIVKRIGTVWEKISIEAVKILGGGFKKVQPNKKYTEEELKEIIEKKFKEECEEVRKIVESDKNKNIFPTIRATSDLAVYPVTSESFFSHPLSGSEKCPRCGFVGFKKDVNRFYGVYGFGDEDDSGIYICNNCHLELTEKQYNIAKRMRYGRWHMEDFIREQIKKDSEVEDLG